MGFRDIQAHLTAARLVLAARLPASREGRTLSAAGLLALTGFWYVRRQRRLAYARPFAHTGKLKDPQAELERIIAWLQDFVVRAIDKRLPGRPFERELQVLPLTPMVLLIGNHSAGKSTFINQLAGVQVQDTGVAPTTDGFTIIERAGPGMHEETEDGPTLIGCPNNASFKDLQRFGQAFWGHLRRVRRKMPEDAAMPLGLQIVDTPGMIDLPVPQAGTAEQQCGGGRGYDFIQAVRWFAMRADLILLFFDPDRPGTTGETLDVLNSSLAGLQHKFLILLNKVDKLDSAEDFARAYGTLGWALSKVMPQKDIPQIYTTYSSVLGDDARVPNESQTWAPLASFKRKRDEIVTEVLRAKGRHWENVITTLEESLRQLQMVTTVTQHVRSKMRRRHLQVQISGIIGCAFPGVFLSWLCWRHLRGEPKALSGVLASYVVACGGAYWALVEHRRQHERLLLASLDDCFEEAYRARLTHGDCGDLQSRWGAIRHRTARVLRAASTAAALPLVPAWEVARIDECLDKDVSRLRSLAKLVRATELSVNGNGV